VRIGVNGIRALTRLELKARVARGDLRDGHLVKVVSLRWRNA
jgi:hypothetical protein